MWTMTFRCCGMASPGTRGAALPAGVKLLLHLFAALPALPARLAGLARLQGSLDHLARPIRLLVIEDPELRPALRGRDVTARRAQEGRPHLALDAFELQ